MDKWDEKDEMYKEAYKDVISAIGVQLIKEPQEQREIITRFLTKKYVMEAFMRPIFGDDDALYEHFSAVIHGANRLGLRK